MGFVVGGLSITISRGFGILACCCIALAVRLVSIAPLPDRAGGVGADLPPLAADDEVLLVLLSAAGTLEFAPLPWADETMLVVVLGFVVVLTTLLPWTAGTVQVLAALLPWLVVMFALLPWAEGMAMFGLMLPVVEPGLETTAGGLAAGGIGVGILGLVPAWDGVEVLGPPLRLVLPLLWTVVAGSFALFSRSPEVTVAVEVLMALAGKNKDSISLS